MINEYFKNRRSIRQYSERSVDTELINSLLEAAAQAPTTGNMQLYSVIITRDPERKAALAPAHFSQPAFMNAPVVLTFCADVRRYTHWCDINDADAGFDNIQSLTAAFLDATIFAQQFVTLAEMEGLGTCYLGTTTYNAPQIAEVLGLPTLVIPVITVTLGWPKGDNEVSDRLPLSALAFDETYHELSTDEIRAAYANKEARADSRHFVKENNVKNLAQVYATARYPRVNNEHFSAILLDFIKQQGF